jgi:hypothetical protein
MLSGLAVSIYGLVICHNTRIVFRNNDGTAVQFLFGRCGLVPKRTFAHIYGNRCFVRRIVFTEPCTESVCSGSRFPSCFFKMRFHIACC